MLADSPAPVWTIKVSAKGSGFDARAALLRAKVGDLAIEGITTVATAPRSAAPPAGGAR
jgi:hypothetical protein